MYENLYVKTDTTDGHNRFDSGNVYSVKKEDAEKMVAEGVAEVVGRSYSIPNGNKRLKSLLTNSKKSEKD